MYDKRDHPRACGAHIARPSGVDVSKGSSPRMRGSRVVVRHGDRIRGIIPAHAGLTPAPLASQHLSRDHPRACGAHPSAGHGAISRWGSSPRMRGSRGARFFNFLDIGIIPAHAGLTSLRALQAILERDHPRACGAHSSSSTAAGLSLGSSPRMRGSPAQPEERHEGLRIIPAHAGLTDVQSKLAVRYRDHPRACGAHVRVTAVNKPTSGSSPHMRGSHTGYDGIVLHVGIIPAHAGLTRSWALLCIFDWDHPRACGAHIVFLSRLSTSAGSSPRMRGSHFEIHDVLMAIGIIPAHAGLTPLCHLLRTCV